MNETDARAGRPEGKTIKRFYREATVGEEGGLWRVLLDGKPMRTPAKAVLAVTSGLLAEAIAGEWAMQAETIAPATMHLTRFANTAIDRVQGREANVLDDILAYAASDLVLYRANAPEGLRARQDAAWKPPLNWARSALQAEFSPVEGVMHAQQPAASIARLGEFLAPFDTFALTALHVMTTMTGSALLTAAYAGGAMDLPAVWVAAHVDEDWQIGKWGEDDEAVARRARRWREMQAAAQLLRLTAP
ncbi:MAG: ATP12 family protein [Hyphomicrobiales bacterium]|nr:ATP12 family protein [Hyphomicrobiales bacterium]